MKSFSPRDIVIVVVSVCAAMILTPVGVMAAASQLVTLKDPTTTSKARVDAGKVRVGDGSGAVTVDGTVKVTDGAGTLGVDGTVDARMVAPAKPWNQINDLTLHAGDTRRPMTARTGATKLNLTSVTVAAEGANPGSIELLVIAYVKTDSTSGDCETLSGFGAAERFTLIVPVGETINVTYPSPLQWTAYADANDYYCIVVESFGGPTGYTAHVSASGFLS